MNRCFTDRSQNRSFELPCKVSPWNQPLTGGKNWEEKEVVASTDRGLSCRYENTREQQRTHVHQFSL